MSRPWTEDCLTALYVLRLAGADLGRAAFALGRTSGEVDRACWALVGGGLRRRGAGAPEPAPARPLSRPLSHRSG